MGLCKGNLGNLMQHWVLCEILDELSRDSQRHLLFACSHSMAPWSVPQPVDYAQEQSSRTRSRRPFDAARRAMVRQPRSLFEFAWQNLSSQDGLPYPSSALFAWQVWANQLSMLLCEANDSVAAEIGAWLGLPETTERLQRRQLHDDDWRTGITNDAIRSFESDVIVAEFDPMRFEHHGTDECSRDDRAVMYPEDLDVVADAFDGIEKPIVLQISSYSANNNNPHRIVEPAITNHLNGAGFTLHGRVEADGNMISLVYVRDISLWPTAQTLGGRFAAWRAGS